MESESKKRIFVSYTQKDEQWALWIAEELEKKGHETITMDWDFMPGDNFVLKMDEALRTSSMVIAVLSRTYLESYHCQSELTAAYAEKNQRLVLVRVDDFRLTGLWAPINYIDLVGKTEEMSIKLLERIFKKPERISKGFPGIVPEGWMPPNNLPDRNNKFTGREKLLEDIYLAFQTKNEVSLVQAQAITGMGGIGKSETAKEYAFCFRMQYEYIWWVNAETDTSIEAAYRSFAQRNELGSPDDNSEKVIAHVKKWMNENLHWLFIFDNADDEKSLENYCSSSGMEGQHILVTSRNQRFRKFVPINISVFTEAEACTFIEKYTKTPADEHFKELAEKMGYLPLALDQAGAYMEINRMTYKDYLDLYNKHNLELLAEEYDDPDKKTVATTWKISFEKINNRASQQLLNLCAFLAPDNIYIQWFKDASDVLPDELRDAAKNDLKYNKAISELTKYSLVTLNDGSISIHRLVQEVIRDSLKNEQAKWRNYCINILNELRYFDFSTVESRNLFLVLSAHIESVTSDIYENDRTEKLSNLYFFLGKGFGEFADYVKALEYYQKALSIFEKVLGKEHPSTATTYNNIAGVYYKQGDYVKVLEYYQKALSIAEKVLGNKHPSTATTYNNIGEIYRNQGDYDKAFEYYQKALFIVEKVLGKEHPNTAATYNNIAEVYDNQGDYINALEYYQKALSIREKVLGKEHSSTATTYNNMAAVYDNQGDYGKALEYYRKALSIIEKVLGIEHPDTATTYNNIALAYCNQADYDEALEYYGKALSIREKVLGKEHPSTATTYNNIAFVYRKQGDYGKALEWYFKSLPILVKVLGFEHPTTEIVFNNMAYAYEKSGNPEPFEKWLEASLSPLTQQT